MKGKIQSHQTGKQTRSTNQLVYARYARNLQAVSINGSLEVEFKNHLLEGPGRELAKLEATVFSSTEVLNWV